LLKYSRDPKTSPTATAFNESLNSIDKKPLDRYCARAIANQTEIMAAASLALARQGINDAIQTAELENISKAIADAPNSLDDHDALMARVTADCWLRVVARATQPGGTSQKITILRNQIASAGVNIGPVMAAEIAMI